MKKMFLVMLASGFAIALSAFTPDKKAVQTYYYKTSSGYAIFTGTPCDPGTHLICKRTQPGVGEVTVLKSQNDNDPLKYD
ncbi:MAG: hypothetical protein ABI675_17930 [Chitinophagaceae bacterium]